MAKDNTFYFSHDYNARSDNKIKRLILKYGMNGYGIFWSLVEDLYNNANALPLEYDVIAFDLRADEDTIKSIINDFDLFIISNGFFSSESVQRRLEDRQLKSSKARKSAFDRWSKTKSDANALQTQSDSNAIKESKVKESKVNENKENSFLLEKETKNNLSEFSNFEEIEVLETEEIKKEKSSAKKDKENKPDLSEFLEYAKQIIIENKLGSLNEYKLAIEAKFEQWSNNDWKDGHGKPIKRWKPKLKTAFQYFKPIKQQNYGNTETRTAESKFIGRMSEETVKRNLQGWE